MKKNCLLFILCSVFLPTVICAQRTAVVNGKYTYTIGDNDNITLREAKHKCVELAKAEAIKAEFGELITSDVIDSNAEVNGESESSYFWENTVAMAKGDWIEDTQEPKIEVEYDDGKLTFKAEVWGKVCEILPPTTEIKWDVLKDGKDGKEPSTQFNSGDRFYVNFHSPADGFVAIYLVLGDNLTSCLLPYKKDPTGRYPIQNGMEYEFFNEEKDPSTLKYKLNTKLPLEYNQIVVIYSPNPFTKCIDNVGDRRHPNSLSTREFQKWLLKCQRTDRDMVVKKKWITIRNSRSEEK